MFVQPMWNDEVERIGFRRCTPVGYTLHGIGGVLGFVGVLSLLAALVNLAYRGLAGTFDASLLWMTLVPLSLGIAGRVCDTAARSMARRKSFRYEYEARVSRWVEDGVERSYTFDDWRNSRQD